MKLHEVLTHYRKLRKVKFDELAERTGISKSTLQKVFTGVTPNPAFELVQTIASALDVSVNDIAAATKETHAGMILSPAALDVARRYDHMSETAQRLISAITLFESADTVVQNRILAMLTSREDE